MKSGQRAVPLLLPALTVAAAVAWALSKLLA